MIEALKNCYYIFKHLPSETKDMLDGPRIVLFRDANFEFGFDENVAEGPFQDLTELKTKSVLYKNLLISDRKRAEKILLDKFIVVPADFVGFPVTSDEEYAKIIHRIMQHSTNGTIKGKDVKGVHVYRSQKVRIIKVTFEDQELKMFKAEIEVLNERTNNWVRKEAETTFFPIDWDIQRLIDECYCAFKNRQKKSETEYIGVTCSGIRVLFQFSKDGQFKTVYPIFE
jgi:hypothetical protein